MEEKISYTHKKSRRARSVRLAVYHDGSVVVTGPFSVGTSIIEKFISDKKQWISDKLSYFKSADYKPVRKFSKKDYLANKEKARALVHERIRFYNQTFGFAFNRICIKNHKSRWGSCSQKGNLNFNYKIVFLSPEMQDYIIVHELCHLKEFNHSKNFWTLIKIAIPNYAKIRKELRNHQFFLDK